MAAMTLNLEQTTELADTFGLLSDPTRLSIVMVCMDQEMSAGEISKKLGSSPSLTSHHLRLLRAARILKSERRGKQIFYTLADACVQSVLNIMTEHLFSHNHSETSNDKETSP